MLTESCILSVVKDTTDKLYSTASKSPGSLDISEYISDTADEDFTDGISDMFSDVKHGTSLMVRMIKLKTKIFMFTV